MKKLDDDTYQDLMETAERVKDYKFALEHIAEMRRFQKAWFRDHKHEDLVHSKMIERTVDLRLKELGFDV